MNKKKDISRRRFVTSAVSAGAAACLLSTRELFAGAARGSNQENRLTQQSAPALLDHPSWKDQGIENLSRSPFAKLKNIPVHAVTIDSGFWEKRRVINVEKSIPSMHDLLEANGRMNNFRRLIGKSTAAQSGPVYSDSDIYKWTEAVGFALQSGPNPALRASAEKFIDDVVATQKANGYLNTYYVDDKAALSMTVQTQTTGHELYNMGHYLQGAIAFYRGTGDPKMLDAGIRFVDDFLLPSYGPPPLKPIVSGHPEIEMALIELYRTTGDRRQLELAGYILSGDDRLQLEPRRTIYMYSGTPFTARTQAGRPCGACDVRLLRRDGLLHGDGRRDVSENAEQFVERHDQHAKCTSPEGWDRARRVKLLAMPTNCRMRALMEKAARQSAT